MNIKVNQLTMDLWPAFESLFGNHGACNGCWCMYWRIGADYHKRSRDLNKQAFHKIVNNGGVPGLLAFQDEIPIGWCQLTPKSSLNWLLKDNSIKSKDDENIWCISCFYIKPSYRKKGVTSALIEAAIKFARKANASLLEAYPRDSNNSFTGYLSTFFKAGFIEVGQCKHGRTLVRKYLIDH